jgi:hypothetical protein
MRIIEIPPSVKPEKKCVNWKSLNMMLSSCFEISWKKERKNKMSVNEKLRKAAQESKSFFLEIEKKVHNEQKDH